MKRVLPLWEKCLACVWLNYLLCFCQLASVPKCRKRKRFYYCYFNMASAAKKMKAATTYKWKFRKNGRSSIQFLEVTATLMLFIAFHAKKVYLVAIKGCQM